MTPQHRPEPVVDAPVVRDDRARRADGGPPVPEGGVVVEVVGRLSLAHALAASDPPGWRTVAVDEASTSPAAGFVVLPRASAGAVREARRRQPQAEVVALLDRGAPAQAAVDVLEAGAAVCVREADAVLVRSYLLRLQGTRAR